MPEKMESNSQIYIVGGGIAGLAAAVFAIRDGHIPGKNIHIFEELDVMGGAMDAKGSADTKYSARGARLINKVAYQCYWDLLSSIPCLAEMDELEKLKPPANLPFDYKHKKTLKDDIFEFNKTHKLNCPCQTDSSVIPDTKSRTRLSDTSPVVLL